MKTDENSYSLSFYYNPSDEHIEEILEALCLTESKEIELIKGYSVRKDHNNPYPIQNHLHLFKNGKQILSMNQDGSAHDGMSGRKRFCQPLKSLILQNFSLSRGGFCGQTVTPNCLTLE